MEFDLPILFVRDRAKQLATQYPALATRGPELERQLEAAGLPILDGLGQFYGGNSPEERRASYEQFLRALRPGVNQLIIHCGYDDAELQAVTSSASRRDGDRRIFSDPETATLLEELHIRVISWKEFRKLRDAP